MNLGMYTNYLTSLLRCAIMGKDAPELPHNFNEDEFFEFCKFHKVENIAYLTIKDKLSKKKREELEVLYNQLLMVQAKQQYYLEEIEEAFENENIDYLVLKGRELARLYPSEDMRQSSDFDIYIGKETPEKAKEIMLGLGYEILAYSDENDDHDEYIIDNFVMAELHRVLIQNNHPWQEECNKMTDRLIKKEGTSHCMELSVEDFYAYNLAHMAKHMKFSGIGIRAFLDQWIIYRQYKDKINQEKLDETLKKCNLYEFNQNAMELCKYWFDGKDNVSDTIKQMADYAAKSGWVGTHEMTTATEVAQNAGATASKNVAKFKKYLEILSTPYEQMVFRYPILKKHRWLTFFCRIHRAIRAIFKRRDLIKNISDEVENTNMNMGKQIVEFKKSIGL